MLRIETVIINTYLMTKEEIGLIITLGVLLAGFTWFLAKTFGELKHDLVKRILGVKDRVHDLEQWSKDEGYKKPDKDD